MNLLERIAAFVAPHDCIGCGLEGSFLCQACEKSLSVATEECYACRKHSPEHLTCSECRSESPLDTAAASFVYEAVAKDLVWKLKFAGGREAALLMARQMRKLLPNDPDTAIVPVPTATGRARRRGYDQAKLLARELSRQTRLPYCDLLARGGQAHQVGSRRQQRLDQLTCAYRTKRKLPRASCYVLVDDVITTGATIEAAATTLLAAGAIKIQAIAYARPKGVRD